MIWIDYIIITIIILSALTGLIRGFVHEVLSLVIWFYAIFIAVHHYNWLAIYYNYIQENIIYNTVTIILLFMTIIVFGIIINYSIKWLIDRAGLLSIDRILGMCIGLLRGISIITLILLFLDIFSNCFPNQDWRKSKLIPQFNIILKYLFYYFQGRLSCLLE